jgi:hypothetical protein
MRVAVCVERNEWSDEGICVVFSEVREIAKDESVVVTPSGFDGYCYYLTTGAGSLVQVQRQSQNRCLRRPRLHYQGIQVVGQMGCQVDSVVEDPGAGDGLAGSKVPAGRCRLAESSPTTSEELRYVCDVLDEMFCGCRHRRLTVERTLSAARSRPSQDCERAADSGSGERCDAQLQTPYASLQRCANVIALTAFTFSSTIHTFCCF